MHKIIQMQQHYRSAEFRLQFQFRCAMWTNGHFWRTFGFGRKQSTTFVNSDGQQLLNRHTTFTLHHWSTISTTARRVHHKS